MHRFLFYPNVADGMGGGHLFRVFAMAEQLDAPSAVVLPDEFQLPKQLESAGVQILRFNDHDFPAMNDGTATVAVIDWRAADTALFEHLGKDWYVVGLDDGGPLRQQMHYLADITMAWLFPGTGNTILSPFPAVSGDVRDLIFPFRHIVITFGSEDKAGLSRILVEKILALKLFEPEAITVIEGPRYTQQHGEAADWPNGIEVFRNVKHLANMLSRYDCVFTHFGLTAFEAAAQGMPVILFNPTPYHRLLSRKAGFLEIGVKRPQAFKLKEFCSARYFFTETRAEMIMEKTRLYDKTIPRLLEHFHPQGKPFCPVCGSMKKKIMARFPDRSYFQCQECMTIRMIRFSGETSAYSREYFFSEYRRQYGKTYLQDFEKIKGFGKSRTGLIQPLLAAIRPGGQDVQALDIGCAYGPFCSAAADAGWTITGLDISTDAIDYVKHTLGFEAYVCDLEHEPLPVPVAEKQYDVLTMWYVLEHFVDVKTIVSLVHSLLGDNGIFAFSTPNGNGISARRSLRQFLFESPADHFTIWPARNVKKALKKAGFTVKKIRITGHHPERFFSRDNYQPGTHRILSRLICVVSKMFGLGDTFEVYAVKTGRRIND
ncbi:MAG: class I SAM-dependent methyltransferase [Spirochaetales bacterium]|nr:class I SAM-dependent methyltransferase [Spirochaetales bacterium]